MRLSEISYNKENIPVSPTTKNNHSIGGGAGIELDVVTGLQHDVAKLEKLYKEEVIKCQSSMSEQERLEIEILSKEKLILQQQQNLQRMTDLNKSLSKKLSREVSYYENTLRNYRNMEKEWDENTTKLKISNLKFDHMFKEKDQELLEITQELEYVKSGFDIKDLEIKKLSNQLEKLLSELEVMKETEPRSQVEEGTPQQVSRYNDSSSDEEDLSSFMLQEDNESSENEEGDNFDVSVNSSSLAQELNNKFGENEKLIKKYQFEIKSLKNEKTQLYNYINKLLKNKPHPDQNSILKEKLVRRKILRAISINQMTSNTQSPKLPATKSRASLGKRVLSNVVNFKSYSNLTRRPIQARLISVYEQNSDDEGDLNEEDVDEIEIRILGNQNFGHTLFKPSPYSMNPLELILLANGGSTKEDSTSEDPSWDID